MPKKLTMGESSIHGLDSTPYPLGWGCNKCVKDNLANKGNRVLRHILDMETKFEQIVSM